ncbi:TIGR01212 family radical SAM protein [Lachnospiraceae bacterium ASD4241]|uniref:TIGR01212 family radical SAM protein n=2 Tax=Diplocloster modestus TaxID=2850322 RepID=A0ABS6KDJ5_9FIRM|nr:TIGR01212 family radical SAM protein [Diplocloster modestus]
MWGPKPYYSLDYYLKQKFGHKVYKLCLNGGMTCPNRDGTVGRGGCIFCSGGGSGEFAGRPEQPVPEQMEYARSLLMKKPEGMTYIAYFQPFTNTYGPVEYLREIFTEAIRYPDVEVLSIATRPDCLGDDVVELLSEINRIKPVWIELGLQTIHEDTAEFIRRGYPLSCFDEAVEKLQKAGIDVITHVILGLPGEDEERMLETVEYLNLKGIQGVKLQSLHVLEQTDLADYYRKGGFRTLEMEEYVRIVIRCIEHLKPDIVIHRLTGDGPRELLIAPQWSAAKTRVLNTIHKWMRENESFQGKYFTGI